MKTPTTGFHVQHFLIMATFVVLPLASGSVCAAPYVWIEGESPTFINVKPDINASGRPHLLSGGKWLTVHADGDEVEKQIPAEGVLIRYAFPVEKAARHAIWGRIGYEFARSPLEWRIDGGAWDKITADDVTTDLTELSFFTELGWRQFGQQDLTAGEHTLELRILKRKNAKGENERLLFGLDAICLTPGTFCANGPFKPGETGRDARDREAEKVVFQLPERPADGAQVGVGLAGLWEVCRHDEDLPGKVAEPISSLPERPLWRAIEVPGDKNTLRDDLVFAHRIWYRTRVAVPQSQKDRSFFLVFPQNNLNTTVYVNGVYCGFEKHPYVHFQIDVSRGIRPGVNEIWVGIRDAWYGYSASPSNPLKLRRHFNTPLQFTHSGFQDLSYPVWSAFESGILVTPTLMSAGRAYVSDVFCKPSVAKKTLDLEVTVANPSASPAAGEVICEAVNSKTGAVEKTFSPAAFQLAAGATQVLQLAEAWANPKLWWPDDPNMYRLRTSLRLGGAGVDVAETPFGFRQWGIDGKNFTLNGYVWHGWNMGIPGSTKEAWLENYRKFHQTQMRMCGATQGGNRPLFNMPPDEALDWCDRNGVAVRRCGPLDGEAIGYFAVETDPELRKLYKSEIKLDLINECREQMVAQVRGERNHPSVQIWSIENEWLYINCINLYGGLMEQFEAQEQKVAEDLKTVDPTRPCMTDGGAANKAQDMPVHGNHYVADPDLTHYPALAYEPNVTGGGRDRWVWDQKRPRYLGEDFFYTGNHPELSTIAGEAAFGGKMATLAGTGLMLQILQQGYRWADYGARDFYCGDGDADNSQWTYMAPRVVLCRQWDWTFASAQKVARTMAVFNDSHDEDPIRVDIQLEVAGKKVFEDSRQFAVTPGQRKEFDLSLPLPAVDVRQEGRLVLSLSVRGRQVWSDTKAVSVLPPVATSDRLGLTSAEKLCVYDPAGGAAAFLTERSIPFTAVANLASLPLSARVLIVGKDAIDAAQCTSSRLAAYASEGRAVIVLEQKNPLKYQALPAEIEAAENVGRVAFAEDLDHPAFRGLAQKDFFTWGPDEILFRQAYRKPVRGAKSLLQCGSSLQNSGLVEVPAGRGVMLLSQLVVGEKLSQNPVAQTLLENLIRYGATYKQVFRPVAVAVSDGSQLARVIDAMGLQYVKAADPLTALRTPGGIALVEATPANLRVLADHAHETESFTQGGGILLLNGLTPEGLASYNKVVGFEHMIRPCKQERVVFPAVRDPLTAGLTTDDVALYSSRQIFPWTAGKYVVSDEFSYVIDYDEVAPFGKSSFFAYDNIVNGFVNADGWPLIINFPGNKDGSPYAIPITLPKPQTITEFTWIGNTNYYPATKVNLIFDGEPSSKISYNVAPSGDPQVLPVDPPRTAQHVTLEIAAWQEKPGARPLLGIDNIYLKAQRPAEFYRTVKPMLNIGGMMHYIRGSGGIVLCNLKFQPREDVPANGVKKQNILAALLRNMQAPFSGSRLVIAGANLEYHPIDLSKQATQFRDEKGWFGDKRFTFRDLPLGRQRFAGVLYDVYDFATSPVPTVVMLAGKGVPGNLPNQVTGIPVGRKADALFFLHAARIDRPMDAREEKEKKRFELFHYVVHYADGGQLDVPVISQFGVDHYRQDAPHGLPDAQIAWTKAYEGTTSAAVAYSMQWSNPHPEKEIATIDVAYGPDASRGVPAVLAITAANAEAEPGGHTSPKSAAQQPPSLTPQPTPRPERADSAAFPAPAPAADGSRLGQGVQRTMTLLASSTPQHRNHVRVLFYGQSITEQEWSKQVAADLRQRFPCADLEIENRAIGGFASQRLIRPAEHDVYPFYPDLVIFHVFGANQEYEQIIGSIRSRTTAEVLMQTDRVGDKWPQEEPNEEADKGLWWDYMMNHRFLPGIADKYACGLCDIRGGWLAYLRANHYEPRQLLLKDGAHLNAQGNFLMAQLTDRHLVLRPDLPTTAWKDLSQIRLVRPSMWSSGRLSLEFDGNRVDFLPVPPSTRGAAPAGGSGRVLIDGKKPSDFPAAYRITRPQPGPWSPLFLSRVDHDAPLVLESWTLTVGHVATEGKTWDFSVCGSVTGPDGSGQSNKPFTSKSGRVKIDPAAWFRGFNPPLPEGYSLRWKVLPMFVDTFQAAKIDDPAKENATTVVQGIFNAKHTLEIIADDPASPPAIASVRSYRPPVKAE